MPYSTLAKNSMLDHLGTEAIFVSLHNGDPGDTGANEISGGTPAYARKSIAWNAAAGGVMGKAASPAVVIDVPAGASIKYVGFWTAVSGGLWKGGALVTQEDFGAQGTYTLTAGTLDLNG